MVKALHSLPLRLLLPLLMGELFCMIIVFPFSLSTFWNAKGKPLAGWSEVLAVLVWQCSEPCGLDHSFSIAQEHCTSTQLSVLSLCMWDRRTGKPLWPLGKKPSRSLLWNRVSKTCVTIKQHGEVLGKYAKGQFYCHYESLLTNQSLILK